MKVVLDTNVLIAAHGTRGLCAAIYEVCLDEHEIVVSEHILDKLARNLSKKFKMPPLLANNVTASVREQATVVKPLDVTQEDCKVLISSQGLKNEPLRHDVFLRCGRCVVVVRVL